MKRIIKFECQGIAGIKFLFFAFLIAGFTGMSAQEKQLITGKLIDRKSNLAVPYANLALIKLPDSTIIRGTISDENGEFNISQAPIGRYRLLVSIIGYKPAFKNIDVMDHGVIDAGIIFLQDTAINIKETVVVGERVKAKSESDRTTFFMTKKILDASSTGTDVLKLIPGIQIDFMQNISLEGSRNIQILVDGKERDGSFISQLNPRQIEKVEVIGKPTSNYDGNITGAINIILIKERSSGINGQIYAEIPASGSEIFIKPTYTLNYGFKKLNLFTSYKGEITYFGIHESTYRKVCNNTGTNEFFSNQYVKQKDWSHRFNYGFDYFLNSHDQFNFYAYYNPYSREFDGIADANSSGSTINYWKAKKEDTDVNSRTFYSLYYKHDFDKEGRMITLDISHFNLNAKNTAEYKDEGNENDVAIRTNIVKPRQNETSIKMDFSTPLAKKLNFSTGLKARVQVLQDRYLKDFYFNETLFAAYSTIAFKNVKYDLNLGTRAEKSVSILKNNFRNPVLSFFPYTSFKYKLNSHQNMQLSYNRSVRRPNIYQLNTHTSFDDPFTLSKGNPFLKPEFCTNIFLEYSIQFKSNYFASRLFSSRINHVINNLMFINDTNVFENQVHNMGTINQYGVQFLGTLKLGIATVNPYLRLFSQNTSANSFTKQYGVENKHNLAFESGLSTIISFKHDLSLSFVFQYASPKNGIQGNNYCDALYFLSLEKTFKKTIKIGIVSAIPFTKSFTYQAADIETSSFYGHYEGNIRMSTIPVWFKLSYQFNSGKNRELINREKEEIDMPKKGF